LANHAFSLVAVHADPFSHGHTRWRLDRHWVRKFSPQLCPTWAKWRNGIAQERGKNNLKYAAAAPCSQKADEGACSSRMFDADCRICGEARGARNCSVQDFDKSSGRGAARANSSGSLQRPQNCYGLPRKLAHPAIARAFTSGIKEMPCGAGLQRIKYLAHKALR